MNNLRIGDALVGALASLLGLVAAQTLVSGFRGPMSGPHSASVQAPAPPNGGIELARELSTAVVELAERVAPAVVQVRSMRQGRRRTATLRDGSGVIVRSSGVVVTNHHVVKDADEFRVILTSGVRLRATLLGIDSDADLAVLQIEAEGPFEALPLSERTPAPGQTVLAMGNPFSLGHSVTTGTVSGLGRSDLEIATYENFIQTDTVINPGNSGGPLIDLWGEVVGINTARGLEKNGDAGINFAIPVTMVRKAVEDIVEHGHVIRGFIALDAYMWFDPEGVEDYDGVSRVRVRSFPGEGVSPAQEAGILVNDIIESVDERRILTLRDLLTAVAAGQPGDTIVVGVWRNGERINVPITLAERAVR